MKPFPYDFEVQMNDGKTVSPNAGPVNERCLALELKASDIAQTYSNLVGLLLVMKESDQTLYNVSYGLSREKMLGLHASLDVIVDRLEEIVAQQPGMEKPLESVRRFRQKIAENRIETIEDLDTEKAVGAVLLSTRITAWKSNHNGDESPSASISKVLRMKMH